MGCQTETKKLHCKCTLCNSVICSEHFEEDCFIYQPFTNRRLLMPGAVPTKFSFSKSTPSRKKTKYEFRQPLLPQDTTIEERLEMSLCKLMKTLLQIF
ncbi:THAP domain-containing protein 3 [Biomphalaria glabrata]|nr:THAP domain-containing protein 1; partial [Biomphalaria glabrata]